MTSAIDYRAPQVMLAYLHPNTVAAAFMASVLNAAGSMTARLHILPIRSGPLSIPDSRNLAVRKFLASDADFLWFVDSDIGFPPDALDRLLAVNASDPRNPVVTVPVAALVDGDDDGMGGQTVTMHPNVYDWTDGGGFSSMKTPLPQDAIIPVDGCGAAFLLIPRAAAAATFDQGYMPEQPFDRMGGLGEDLSFSRRLAVAEWPLLAYTGIRATHWKLIPIG